MENEIIIAHQIIDCQNAIGIDIFGMYHTLRDLGYDTYFLAEKVIGLNCNYYVDEEKVNGALSNPNSYLIYYYCNKWDFGEYYLNNFEGKKIIKVCTISPPDIFQNGPSNYYEVSFRKWTDIEFFIQKHTDCIIWVNTYYEKTLLKKKGVLNNCFIVYPFNRISVIKEQKINFYIIDSLINNHCNNILTVGDITPNRGHYHLIEIINSYLYQFGPNIHLWIIGAKEKTHLKSYYDSILMTINRYNLKDHISFIDSVSMEDLCGYYLGCDAFLCMSEYENFYDPFIEAQRFGLPIVTYGGSSLSEIVGKNQIVLNEFDYDFAASALFTIYTDEKVKRFCRYHGFENVKFRFSPVQIMKEFASALHQSVVTIR